MKSAVLKFKHGWKSQGKQVGCYSPLQCYNSQNMQAEIKQKIISCPQGHYYDVNRYDNCPYCSSGGVYPTVDPFAPVQPSAGSTVYGEPGGERLSVRPQQQLFMLAKQAVERVNGLLGESGLRKSGSTMVMGLVRAVGTGGI